jgi:hypothetical protein
MTDEPFTGFGEDYCLSFYSVPKDELPRRRLEEGEAVDFLELHGTNCGEEVRSIYH